MYVIFPWWNILYLKQDFLVAYGYLTPPDPKSGRLIDPNHVTESIKTMQKYAGLTPTGIIDKQTLFVMKTPRCGMKDVGRADSARRKRRYNLQGGKWIKKVSLLPADYMVSRWTEVWYSASESCSLPIIIAFYHTHFYHEFWRRLPIFDYFLPVSTKSTNV